MQGASEDRTEPYGLYGKGGPELVTTQMSLWVVRHSKYSGALA